MIKTDEKYIGNEDKTIYHKFSKDIKTDVRIINYII